MATASVYLRRSKKPGERSVSLAGQEAELRELCARLGADVVHVHADPGLSGALLDRPGFRAWLADAPNVDILACWAIDRASRSGILGAAAIMEAIEGTGTRFLSVDGLDSEQPGFGINLAVRAEIAKEERARTVLRSKATRRRLEAEGRHASGPPPYGTMLDDDRRLVPNPQEAAVLVEVVERLLSGWGIRRVLADLNERDIVTRRGNPWTRSSLVTTLESEATRKHVLTLAQQRALEPVLHPAPGSRRRGGRPAVWLLSGLATCAGCGRPLTTSKDAKRDVTRYVCPTTTSVAPCPARVTIRADRADDVVVQAYLDTWGPLTWFEEKVTVTGGDVDTEERAVEAAQEALLASPTAENLATYQEAQEALEEARQRPITRTVELVASDTYAEQWVNLDIPGRQGVLRQAAVEISIRKSEGPYFDPSRVQITWLKDVE